ncbi:MAG: T9SS type A sorting domain-containing protein [Bacteroidales bacterium]|nr:T9SS type A sorting domain-containing protein [Bacteroidales bacterium]
MLNKLCLSILLAPLLALSQNPPVCDSVFIDCCNSNQINSTGITIDVSNYSSYLFPYPGFIILDDNHDTIGIETVNYYGIPPYPQPHVIEFKSPPDLPFTGTLELHSLFYDTLNCVFEIIIPDTVLSSISDYPKLAFDLYPNPAEGSFNIFLENGNSNERLTMEVINSLGRLVYTGFLKFAKNGIQTDDLGGKGLYVVRVKDSFQQVLFIRKLVVL